MSHWWRAYDEALNDPKLQQLPPELFKDWFNLLCITSANGGKLPDLNEIAFKLRKSTKKAKENIKKLVDAGLFDFGPDGSLAPHNWSGRQFKSDSSNERVKRYRERQRNAECNVTGNSAETPPDTDTDTDTDTEKEAETREERESDSSLRSESAPAAPRYADVVHELWAEGKLILIQLGVDEKLAGQMVGKWLRDAKDDHARVYDAIKGARAARTPQPIPWVTGALKVAKAPYQAKPDPVMDGLRRCYENISDDFAQAA